MADNIYTKLAQMRVELQRKNIKKSGKNTYSGYDYYELADILPPINELQEKYKTCSFISFDSERATLVIVNSENPEESITFTSPMADLTLKAAHPIQNLGGVETYQRRYLYMAAFEIIENDYFDATQGKEDKKSAPAQRKSDAQPQRKSEPKSTMSEFNAAELNKLIKELSALSGKKVAVIVKDVASAIGKDIAAMTDDDAEEVKYLLNTWIAAYEEGVE